MMVLLLLYTPEHKQQQKKIDQKIPQSYNNCNLSVPKKVFFTHIEPDKKKSKRNVFVLTEVPKRQQLLQENKKSERNPGKKNPNEIYS